MTDVVHLKRTYLERTETFVHMQLAYLRRYRASILARQARNLDRFPCPRPASFVDDARGPGRSVACLTYRLARVMAPSELGFYTRAVSRARPDLLHAHFAVDAAYFLRVKRQLGLPLVVSCYGYDVSSFPGKYLGLGARYLRPVWRDADLILAMSRDMKRDILRLGCPADKVRVHYYGVDLRRFPHVERASPAEPPTVLFVGSLGDERKGVDDLLNGFAAAARERPDLRLRIVGDGRFRARYQQLAGDLGQADRVSFAGFVAHEHLAEELARADVFAHPSVTTASYDKEGIPGTIVEAMAAGLPVVTTRHAGIPEIVTDGEHGYVVAEHDIMGIAQALVALAGDRARRKALGAAAAARARERADAVKQTAELEEIYDDMLAATRARRLDGEPCVASAVV